MSWRDRLKGFSPASFRGAKFYIEDSERSSGIHTVIQELLPDDKDTTTQGIVYTDCFGQGLDEFNITGYVLANKDNNYDYMPERDALIEALRVQDKGTLRHPYYGEIEVWLVGKASIRETIAEGGIARFSMTFVQHFELPEPAKSISADEGVDNTVDKSVKKASDMLMEKLKMTGVHIQAAADVMKAAMQYYIDAVRRIRGGISQFQAEATGAISNLILTIDEIIDSPKDVMDALQSAAQSIMDVCGFGTETIYGGTVGGYSGERRGEVTTLDGVSVPEDIGTSAVEGIIEAADYSYEDLSWVQEEQEENVKILLCYNKMILLGLVARITMRIDFNSQETAEYYRDEIKEAMESALLAIGDLVDVDIDENQLYSAMEDVRNNFMQNFESKIAGISKSLDYIVPADGVSALVLAYDKYYDLERDSDIFERNRTLIKNPNFCPGGEVLRILNE